MIMDDIKKVTAELEQEAQMPPINVELVDNELALVYANSARADVSTLNSQYNMKLNLIFRIIFLQLEWNFTHVIFMKWNYVKRNF